MSRITGSTLAANCLAAAFVAAVPCFAALASVGFPKRTPRRLAAASASLVRWWGRKHYAPTVSFELGKPKGLTTVGKRTDTNSLNPGSLTMRKKSSLELLCRTP